MLTEKRQVYFPGLERQATGNRESGDWKDQVSILTCTLPVERRGENTGRYSYL